MGEKRAPIEVTDAAVQQILTLLAARGKPAAGIKVGVKSGGCSGLTYEIEYADKAEPFYEAVETGGVTIFIDPKAILYLIGSTMDYKEEKMKSGFIFTNPNEKGQCGCGESFHV